METQNGILTRSNRVAFGNLQNVSKMYKNSILTSLFVWCTNEFVINFYGLTHADAEKCAKIRIIRIAE